LTATDYHIERHIKRVFESKVKKVGSRQKHVTLHYNQVVGIETFLKIFKFKKYETVFETLDEWETKVVNLKVDGKIIGSHNVALIYHEPTNTTYWKYNH
jgi:hypothetical protein